MQLSHSTLATLLATSATLFTPILAIDTDANPQKAFSFLTANTALDRLNLASDSDLMYDFSHNPHYSLSPGSVCVANAATMPILRGLGMSVSQLNLSPCSMLPPHLHRATNLVVAISGTTDTFMIQENGARLVRETLTAGKMTIFPAASLHSMVNNDCHAQALLYSFLGSEDAGTLNVVNQLFQLPEDLLTVVMPFLNASGVTGNAWNKSVGMIPAVGTGSNKGSQSCLARCGLKSRDDTAQGGYRVIR